MFTAKERVLLDKDGNCVPANDPSGVQVLAGFKGAQIAPKQFKTAKVKGFEKFFSGGPLDDAKKEAKQEAMEPAKRVAPEPKPTHPKAAKIKRK